MDFWLLKDQLLDGMRWSLRIVPLLLARLTRRPKLDWEEQEPLDEALDEWQQGIDNRIPLCCRVRFVWDYHRGRSPALMRGAVTESKTLDGYSLDVYVPCRVIHRGPSVLNREP